MPSTQETELLGPAKERRKRFSRYKSKTEHANVTIQFLDMEEVEFVLCVVEKELIAKNKDYAIHVFKRRDECEEH